MRPSEGHPFLHLGADTSPIKVNRHFSIDLNEHWLKPLYSEIAQYQDVQTSVLGTQASPNVELGTTFWSPILKIRLLTFQTSFSRILAFLPLCIAAKPWLKKAEHLVCKGNTNEAWWHLVNTFLDELWLSQNTFLQLYKTNVIESAPGDPVMKTAVCLPSMSYCRQKSLRNRYLFFPVSLMLKRQVQSVQQSQVKNLSLILGFPPWVWDGLLLLICKLNTVFLQCGCYLKPFLGLELSCEQVAISTWHFSCFVWTQKASSSAGVSWCSITDINGTMLTYTWWN